jgi:hypothetical protein
VSRNAASLSVLLLLLVFSSSCGTTSDALPEPEHTRVYDREYEVVWQAAAAAFTDVNMSLTDRRRADGVLKASTGFSMCDFKGLEATVILTDQGSSRVRVEVRAAAQGAKLGASPCANGVVKRYLAALDARLHIAP